MLELVLVVSDFYLAQETPERELPAGVALPGLHHVARFATRSDVPDGWRPWLSRWLTGREPQGIATVAAGPLTRAAAPPASTPPGPAVQASPTPAALATAPMVWMATPVHLVAGLASLHLDRRSVLRLGAEDQFALAAEFQRIFDDSGFYLQPLDSGDFLLFGPKSSMTGSSEPARSMGASVAEARAADPALQRLGAEIEMWLHEHSVNVGRMRRGEAPVTGLWLWGGGPSPGAARSLDPAASINARAPASAPARPAGETTPASAPGSAATSPDIAFGCDAFMQGLWLSINQKVFPLTPQLADVFSYPHARRAALVIEIGPMLHSHPNWTFFDAVAQIDRDYIAPAVQALQGGNLERLLILANDRQLTLRARDRFKVWRRSVPGLSGLQ